MKRLIVAAAGAGALSLALIAGPITAGASTGARATASRADRPHTAAVVTVTPHANLKAGTVVTVTGSGFPDGVSYIYTECNADGGGPGATTGSCDTSAIKTGTTSGTGTFSGTYTIVAGQMTKGKNGTACAQSVTQAQHAVACIIGAVTGLGTKTEDFAFSPILFTAPPLTFTYAKSVMSGGVQTYSIKITEAGDYVLHAGQNNGGYLVIGAYGSAVPPSRVCQGTTTGKTWKPPSLPACTKFFGEVVQINFHGKKIALLRVGANDPGSFSWTIKSAKPGKYSIQALGLVSGESVTDTATVP